MYIILCMYIYIYIERERERYTHIGLPHLPGGVLPGGAHGPDALQAPCPPGSNRRWRMAR